GLDVSTCDVITNRGEPAIANQQLRYDAFIRIHSMDLAVDQGQIAYFLRSRWSRLCIDLLQTRGADGTDRRSGGAAQELPPRKPLSIHVAFLSHIFPFLKAVAKHGLNSLSTSAITAIISIWILYRSMERALRLQMFKKWLSGGAALRYIQQQPQGCPVLVP